MSSSSLAPTLREKTDEGNFALMPQRTMTNEYRAAPFRPKKTEGRGGSRVKPGHGRNLLATREFVIAGLDPAIHGMSQYLRALV
jgi:hypothetical protein